MKNKFILILLLALAVFGCEPDDEPEKTTISLQKKDEGFDQRLLTGDNLITYGLPAWYSFSFNYGVFEADYSKGFFQFFVSNNIIHMRTGNTHLSDIYYQPNQSYIFEIYSKGGIIYRTSDDKKLLKYEFHTKWPYPDDNSYGLPEAIRQQFYLIAADGKIITYSIYNEDGSIYNDNRSIYDWVLMLFTE
jgi:hypothetical protein